MFNLKFKTLLRVMFCSLNENTKQFIVHSAIFRFISITYFFLTVAVNVDWLSKFVDFKDRNAELKFVEKNNSKKKKTFYYIKKKIIFYR